MSNTRSSGSSSGNSTNFNNALLIAGFKTGSGSSSGSNWSHSTGQNSSYSKSLTRSTQTSRADGVSASESKSNTESSTAGWSDTVHKRLLLNPDEIGRFFAPVSNSDHPAYPGLAGALIIGEHPVLVRRVNYYQSARFSGFFDPHPDHEPPPTLEELAERAKPKPLPKPPPQSTIPRYVEPAQLNFVEDSRPSWTPVILSIVGIALVAVIAVFTFSPSKRSFSTNYPTSNTYSTSSVSSVSPTPTPAAISLPAAPPIVAPVLQRPKTGEDYWNEAQDVYKRCGDHCIGDVAYKEYFPLVLKAAESGFITAQFAVGYAYFNGDRVIQNIQEGVKWLQLASDSGELNASITLADAYSYGKNGFRKDRVVACKLWRLAKRQGASDGATSYYIQKFC